MYVANLPLALIWAWFALRARCLFFFSAVNPAIETGGMWGESKYHILQRIPSGYWPQTVLVKQGTDFQDVLQKINQKGIQYPMIVKPNIGERGFLVSKIRNEEELRNHLSLYATDFLVQQFVNLPLELAVMYHRFPDTGQGQVTSICVKETMKVTGDGHSTIRTLMDKHPRSKLQVARFEAGFPEILSKIPEPGQTIELEPIGNHCRGTMFLNGNHHIDAALTAVFDRVASQMKDIHYGRFDLKCRSVEDLRNGGGFTVMEYNGIGAEPAHIYDPAYPVWKKYRDIYQHWLIIYRIYKKQAGKGVKSMNLKEAIASLNAYLNYKKSFNT